MFYLVLNPLFLQVLNASIYILLSPQYILLLTKIRANFRAKNSNNICSIAGVIIILLHFHFIIDNLKRQRSRK
ncbi:hypothetical protein HMPREF3180_00122 [Leptotrichia wadei]|uniref:Uncharacterized protein n=1 Tax=Leptotrichia wadei TaxID=157687 RepID=A0A134AR92_9FUSO|nr:hypothetical protein HMPREF3180_00122 [Leptotrichia wadei]